MHETVSTAPVLKRHTVPWRQKYKGIITPGTKSVGIYLKRDINIYRGRLKDTRNRKAGGRWGWGWGWVAMKV